MAENVPTLLIRVKLFGHLKQISQEQDIDCEVQAGSTVYNLIQNLSDRLGNDFHRAVLDSRGNLQGGIEIVLDQQHLPARKIAAIPLLEDCEVFILPMIEGGGIPANIVN